MSQWFFLRPSSLTLLKATHTPVMRGVALCGNGNLGFPRCKRCRTFFPVGGDHVNMISLISPKPDLSWMAGCFNCNFTLSCTYTCASRVVKMGNVRQSRAVASHGGSFQCLPCCPIGRFCNFMPLTRWQRPATSG